MYSFLLFLLFPHFISSAEKCEDRVIDLDKGNFTINQAVFYLNQSCEWKFTVSNDSFMDVHFEVANFYECWYQMENFVGKVTIGPQGLVTSEQAVAPPPVYYLRWYFTETNMNYQNNNELARIVEVSVSRLKLPFSTATKLDIATESPILYSIEKPTEVILVPVKASVVFQHLCGLTDRLAEIYLFNGTATSQSLIGTAKNYTQPTVFNHDIFVVWLEKTKSCIMMFIDGSEYEKYGEYQLTFTPSDPVPLSAETKLHALSINARNGAYESFLLKSFFLEEITVPPGSTLYIFKGAPTNDNRTLLYAVRSDSTNITYPLIFNGLVYTFVLYNGSTTLQFTETFNVDKFTDRELRITPEGYITGYMFQGNKTTYFNISCEGPGSGFSIQPDASMFSYGPRDGVIQYNSSRLYIPSVSVNGVVTINISSVSSTMFLYHGFFLPLANLLVSKQY